MTRSHKEKGGSPVFKSDPSPVPESRVEKFYFGLGILCFIAYLVMRFLGYGGPGTYFAAIGLGVVVFVLGGVVVSIFRSVFRQERARDQSDDTSEISPAQRVRNAHRRPHR